MPGICVLTSRQRQEFGRCQGSYDSAMTCRPLCFSIPQERLNYFNYFSWASDRARWLNSLLIYLGQFETWELILQFEQRNTMVDWKYHSKYGTNKRIHQSIAEHHAKPRSLMKTKYHWFKLLKKKTSRPMLLNLWVMTLSQGLPKTNMHIRFLHFNS